MRDMVIVNLDGQYFCDKCGERVPNHNDVVMFKSYAKIATGAACFFGQARHLLPVVRDEKVVCEGSPELAQYLEGQPRDAQPGSTYDQALEAPYRAAYAELYRDWSPDESEPNE